MQTKSWSLSQKFIKVLKISIFSFISSNIYFYIIQNNFEKLNPLLTTMVIIFIQNFFLLIINNIFEYKINHLLKFIFIIFLGRIFEILIFLFLEHFIFVSYQLIFFVTLIISNIFKISLIILFSKNKFK
jgi:hypothetical protein